MNYNSESYWECFKFLVAFLPWPIILLLAFLFVCTLLGIYDAANGQ